MFFRTLNSKFRELMRQHALSDDELRQSSVEMKIKQKKTMIGFIISMIGLTILFIWNICSQIKNDTLADPLPLEITYTTILIIVIGILGYFFTMGVFKIQFNKELKANYPELYDELKL